MWSFEPHPANFAFLRRHVEINRLGNVQVEQLAVSERPGTLRFESGRGSGTGRLASEGALSVTVTALDAFCDARSIRPTAIKIDVEGAELEVLRGAGSILRQCAPVLFLSTHGAKVHAACIESLRALGYGVQPIDAATLEGASELLAVKEGGQGRG